jgi:hypothetical protein
MIPCPPNACASSCLFAGVLRLVVFVRGCLAPAAGGVCRALTPRPRAGLRAAARGRRLPRDRANVPHGPAPPRRTEWTRRVPHPVLIGHAASLTPYYARRSRVPAVPPRSVSSRDKACPFSTGGGTRRVQSVRDRGGGGGGHTVPPRSVSSMAPMVNTPARASRAPPRLSALPRRSCWRASRSSQR